LYWPALSRRAGVRPPWGAPGRSGGGADRGRGVGRESRRHGGFRARVGAASEARRDVRPSRVTSQSPSVIRFTNAATPTLRCPPASSGGCFVVRLRFFAAILPSIVAARDSARSKSVWSLHGSGRLLPNCVHIFNRVHHLRLHLGYYYPLGHRLCTFCLRFSSPLITFSVLIFVEVNPRQISEASQLRGRTKEIRRASTQGTS